MGGIKDLYDSIQKIYGQSLPRQVATEVARLIPKELSPDEDAYDKYVYLHGIYTIGEYMSSLSMYDKCYSSPMHQYGELEELLYSFKPVSPGLVKDHRIRNSRGKFVHTTETIEPKQLNITQPNVFLIKRTIWDSLKYDKKMITYSIYVYKHNAQVESQRRKQAEETLANMKASYEASEKGCIPDAKTS